MLQVDIDERHEGVHDPGHRAVPMVVLRARSWSTDQDARPVNARRREWWGETRRRACTLRWAGWQVGRHVCKQ